MANSLPITAPICCPFNGGGDLIPLLVVVVMVLAGHVFFQEFKKRKGKPAMKMMKNSAITAALLIAVVAVFAAKQNLNKPADLVQPPPTEATAPVVTPVETTSAPDQPAALPRLVDLGADKCTPCKMMAPILAEMKTTYANQLQVEFIDVWKNPDAGEQYAIRIIPTQIFFDAQGKELFRHEGFFGKEDMLAKWQELGVDLQPKNAP